MPSVIGTQRLRVLLSVESGFNDGLALPLAASRDVILRAGPKVIRNAFDWEGTLLDLRVGDAVQLRVRRGSRELDVTTTVRDLPEVTAPKVQVLRDLQLTTVTAAIRAERGIRSTSGALITRAGAATAEELGVQPGDVIVQINRTRIASAQEAAQAHYFKLCFSALARWSFHEYKSMSLRCAGSCNGSRDSHR